MAKASAILRDVKNAIREPYAWPGGYLKYLVTDDGESLSCAAAKANFRHIVRSTLQRASDGWRVLGVDINWEDPDLYCVQTGERIESAYAEPEEESK